MVAATTARRAATAVADRATKSRAVHIKISPRTRSIHESREILKVLKKFGEVLWFQNLRYDRINPAPNTLICVYEDADAAAELIRESPMRFTIPPPSSITEPVASVASMGILEAFKDMPHESEMTPERQRANEASKNASNSGGREKEFILSADVSLVDHEAAMQQKEFSWGFRMQIRNAHQTSLARQVPEQGMAVLTPDQRTVPARIVSREIKAVEKFAQDVRERLQS